MRTFGKVVTAGLAVAFLALVGPAQAAPALTPEEILKFSTEKMAGYQTWSADYTQTLPMFGGQMILHGRITQKMPGRLRLEMDLPVMGQSGQMIMVLGADRILWQDLTMGGQRQVTRIDMTSAVSNALAKTGLNIDPLAAMDPTQQWKTQQKFLNFTVQPSESLAGQPTYVLAGTLKDSVLTNQQAAALAQMLGKMRLFIGQQDGFVRKVEQYGKSGTNIFMTMEFREVKFNVPVPDAAFVYRPPPDAKVLDMTRMLDGMGAMGTSQAPPPSAAPALVKPEATPPPAPAP